MNTVPNEPTYLFSLLFMVGILLILLAFAFAADAVIRFFHAQHMREEQKRAWIQFRVWISESAASEESTSGEVTAVAAGALIANVERPVRQDVRGQLAPTP